MSSQEDAYWIQLAVEDFGKRVWQRGLSKFALDHEFGEKVETFSYADYSININRPTEDYINVTIEKTIPEPTIVVLFYFVEYPTMPPKIATWGTETALELLENTTELWQENMYTRSH